jgi:hypothetical protein
MQVLFQFSMQNPHFTPREALAQLVSNLPMPMNATLQQTQGQRTPNLNGSSQFASPSVAHLGLPGAQGSPHIGHSAHASPAQNPLAGPVGLVAQKNQAGAGSSANQGANANTSPSVSNKRRRSTVKMEGDDGGGPAEVNGAGAPGAGKVKASPRVGGKRQKGTS